MIIAKEYKYNPLTESITCEIDNELIRRMFEVAGGEAGLDAVLNEDGEYDPYSPDKILRFILRTTKFLIMSVDLTYEEWDGNVYTITYDNSITPADGVNAETVLLELVANGI